MGPIKKHGPVVEAGTFSFTRLTLNRLASAINHERMPVLLAGAEQWVAWLDGSGADARRLITPFAGQRMIVVQRNREIHGGLTAIK
jgi:putative SOS response-associated peptidase YedK